VGGAFAASILLAASLAGAPAVAQTGGGTDREPRPGDPCSPWGGNYTGLECCYFPGQGWYYYFDVVGGGFCGGYYYQTPEKPGDRPAEEPTEPAGR
jgi:hypothetical protein